MSMMDKAHAEIVSILTSGREWCECRRSPFDWHDVNPPCSTVLRAHEQADQIITALVELGKELNT